MNGLNINSADAKLPVPLPFMKSKSASIYPNTDARGGSRISYFHAKNQLVIANNSSYLAMPGPYLDHGSLVHIPAFTITLENTNSENVSFPSEAVGTMISTGLQEPLDVDLRGVYFVRALVNLINNVPLEDGCSHPAEAVVENVLGTAGLSAGQWIRTAYDEHLCRQPGLAAAILRIMGRLPFHTVKSWGRPLVYQALHHPDAEIRDAAVRAIEMWEDRNAIGALRARVPQEQLPWLARYIRGVIEDLAG